MLKISINNNMCSIIYVSNLLFLCTIIPSHVTVGLPNIITADRYYSDYIEQNSGSKVLSSSSLYVLGNDIASGIFVDRNIIEEDDASLVPRKLKTPFKGNEQFIYLYFRSFQKFFRIYEFKL